MFRSVTPIALAALFTACAPEDDAALDPVVDEATALEMAESALEAYNDDDYEGWIEHWNDEMLGMITPEGWDELQATLMATSGAWVSIDEVALEPADTNGYVRYVFETTFENEPVRLTYVFPEDGDRIAGVFLASESLGGY